MAVKNVSPRRTSFKGGCFDVSPLRGWLTSGCSCVRPTVPVLFDSEQGMIGVLVPVMLTTEKYQKLKNWMAANPNIKLSLDEAIPILVTSALEEL